MAVNALSVVFTSIYRFTTLFKFHPADITWTLAESCTWCLIESSSGIISACMPTLRPLVAMITSSLGSHHGSRFSRPTKTKTSYGGNGRSGLSLRPADELLAKTNVHLQTTRPDDCSGDEVPLNSIMVRHDMMWQESSCDSRSRYT